MERLIERETLVKERSGLTKQVTLGLPVCYGLSEALLQNKHPHIEQCHGQRACLTVRAQKAHTAFKIGGCAIIHPLITIDPTHPIARQFCSPGIPKANAQPQTLEQSLAGEPLIPLLVRQKSQPEPGTRDTSLISNLFENGQRCLVLRLCVCPVPLPHAEDAQRVQGIGACR